MTIRLTKKLVKDLKSAEEGYNIVGNSNEFYLIFGEDNDINSRSPAEGMHCFFGQGELLNIWIWEGLRKDYIPVVLAHELKEDGNKANHEKAVIFENKFAEMYFDSQEELSGYRSWRDSLE